MTGAGFTIPGFVGAKGAFLHDDKVLTCLRDDFPSIPWPGHWDLPGGGREGEESPENCLLRELQEEFGLALHPGRLIWRRAFPSMMDATRTGWFFAARLTAAEIAAIRFGDEGQDWCLMAVTDYLVHPRAVGPMQERLRLAWEAVGG